MLGLQLIGSFMVIFVVAYLFGTIFPIINRNLLIPLTMIYIAFFMLYGKYMHPPASALKSGELSRFINTIQKALGFNMADIAYWFILFFLWILTAGIFMYVFDLFMRERAKEIFLAMEKNLSLYGVRNIFLIACFLIPIVLFAGMYYRFITTGMMFLGVLAFTSGQLEVLLSSAKLRSIKMDDKNVFFTTCFSALNAILLFIFMIALIMKRT